MAEALSLERLPRTASDVVDHSEDPRTVNLAVPEMHCGGCMRKVERTLLAVPGVSSARANLSAKRVSITSTAASSDPERFIEVLRGAGFPAALLLQSRPLNRTAVDQDYLKRVGVAGFAAANIMLLSVAVWSGQAGDMPASLQTLFHWLSALIALPAVAYAGQPFFSSARRALASRRLNMDVPISLGVSLATAMSLYQTMRGSEQVYFDAAITLLFFLLIGRALDQRMRQRAASAAENLLGLRVPSTSAIDDSGTVTRIPTSDVRPGQRFLVAAGERIPVDARLLQGTTDIDESLITGESRPRRALVGDRLYCGTINLTAPVEAVATAVADNTLLAEIARLIATAEQVRGRYVRLADRAAQLYAPAVHVLGAATFIGWLLAGYGWEPALTAAIAVLIITCPCALALAVPAVQVVATGRLFRSGVVLKAADGLERLAEIDTIVFDKTGTLTLGEPRVLNAATLPDTVLARASGLALQSRHPYARAVVEAARERRLTVPLREGVTETAGAGLVARGMDGECRLGSAAHCGAQSDTTQSQSIWFRERDREPIAFNLADTLRHDVRGTIAALVRSGYGVEILSGDRKDAVAEAARATGIEIWRAEQRPEEKLAYIQMLTAKGRKVLMVGDGLNDAPALAAGHASISPANAADISQTAADAVLQGATLHPITETLALARAARQRALENFAIALGYNILFVPLAVTGVVTPLIAAIAMSASSIAVTVNALRLSRGKEVVQ
jgi:P-type Cu2+ transporter